MTNGLQLRVSIRAPILFFVAQAPVEITVKEWYLPLRKQVIHELRSRTVESLKHWCEMLSIEHIPNRVIMIVHQCADEEFESIVFGVAIKLVPKDFLSAGICKSVEFVSATYCEKIQRIVAIPVLQAMTFFENFSAACGSPFHKFSLRNSARISYKFRNARSRNVRCFPFNMAAEAATPRQSRQSGALFRSRTFLCAGPFAKPCSSPHPSKPRNKMRKPRDLLRDAILYL